jgi:hypothetical protein
MSGLLLDRSGKGAVRIMRRDKGGLKENKICEAHRGTPGLVDVKMEATVFGVLKNFCI